MSYEASTTSAAIVGTAGRLLVSYPGPAFDVPWSAIRDSTFLARFSQFVGEMKRQTVFAALATSTKANEVVAEERESAHPKFITEMLSGILRAVGKVADVERFIKRVGDEVMWDNALIPWRRSPLWLVVRVSLQLTLGREEFKEFMVYFMARILGHAARSDIKGHLLFVMNSKLSRRVYKLQDRLPMFVLDEAQYSGELAHSRIELEWLQVQTAIAESPWDLKGLDHEKDTTITMERSREYIRGLRRFKCRELDTGSFVPQEAVRYSRTAVKIPPLPGARESEERKDIMLADFETWVTASLGRWTAKYLVDTESGSKLLGSSVAEYITVAKSAYHESPEKNSIMLLTTMELWMALDRLTSKSCPLLADYSPEFTESFLSALLLPQAQQRVRVSSIEAYIKKRRFEALPTSDSIFSGNITDRSFSVRYFRSSTSLMQLRADILNDAASAQSRKKDELERVTREYRRLEALADTLSCDYNIRRGRPKHAKKCQKCRISRDIAGMKIEIYEWPLPERSCEEAATVFELRCPTEFAIWREMTFRILTDLCSVTTPAPREGELHDTCALYHGLKSYYRTQLNSDIHTLHYTSSKKSFLSSHYRNVALPTTESSVCLKNPLKFALHDTRTDIWTSDRPSEIDVSHLCTFRLPSGPYEGLQYSLTNPYHNPNEVLARQNECPPELQLHEYIAFGLLRAGARLQWLNILRELRSRTLTFSNEAVNLLHLQTAWQVGLPGDNGQERESHVEPAEEKFGIEVIRELTEMLRGVEGNWQERITVHTTIALAGQILAMTESPEARSQAVTFLREARKVCLQWVRELARKVPDLGPGETNAIQTLVVHTAATCRMTFDVQECWLADVLSTREDVSVFAECGTMIRNYAHLIPSTSTTKQILGRDRRTAYAVEQRLRKLVTVRDIGLDVAPIWPAYEPGGSWTAEESPNERWVYTFTKQSRVRKSQEVYYNLVSGELLVDNCTVGRLPISYTSHATYRELLGEVRIHIPRRRVTLMDGI